MGGREPPLQAKARSVLCYFRFAFSVRRHNTWSSRRGTGASSSSSDFGLDWHCYLPPGLFNQKCILSTIAVLAAPYMVLVRFLPPTRRLPPAGEPGRERILEKYHGGRVWGTRQRASAQLVPPDSLNSAIPVHTSCPRFNRNGWQELPITT